jgi:small redox-active disulfide protein 2
MKIQVLGTGCARCRQLYAEVEQALGAAGVPAELEKVDRIDEIRQFAVMMTPALVIDGEVKASGRIPPSSEIAAWIAAAAEKGQ